MSTEGIGSVEVFLEEWRAERPDIDPSAMLTVGRLLLRLAATIHDQIDLVAAQHGVSRSDSDVLFALRRLGGASEEEELPGALILGPSDTARQIDDLVRRRLVERLSGAQGDPGPVVRLTADGAAVVERLLREHLRSGERLLAPLDGEQRNVLNDFLSRLVLPLEASRNAASSGSEHAGPFTEP